MVPVTWGLEVANVIGKAEMKGLVREAQSEAFLEMLDSIDIRADTVTFPRARSDTLQIARRYRLSSCDASYLELALRAGLPLATRDRDLQTAANKAGVPRFAARQMPRPAARLAKPAQRPPPVVKRQPSERRTEVC